MLRIIAALFGIVLIFVGVAGFLPSFFKDGLLFGYFMVNPIHNLVHLVTGVLAIMAATRYDLSRLFFRVFGIIYLIVGILGFILAGDLYLMHVNTADNILHLVIALVSLYLGFFLNSV